MPSPSLHAGSSRKRAASTLTCLTAGGQPVSKALTAGSGKPASVRVGAVHLWLEPLAGRRGGTNAYIVVATYL
ncbi:hypothetical protein ACTMU2_18620 [Cupriavidus basilensis]